MKLIGFNALRLNTNPTTQRTYTENYYVYINSEEISSIFNSDIRYSDGMGDYYVSSTIILKNNSFCDVKGSPQEVYERIISYE